MKENPDNKPPRILVLSNADFESRGFQAIVRGLEHCLGECLPGLTLEYFSFAPKRYCYLESKGLKLISHPWANGNCETLNTFSYLVLIPKSLLRAVYYKLRPAKNPYRHYNALLHINVDCLNETDYGFVCVCLNLLKSWAGLRAFGCPLLTAPVDIGPFNTPVSRFMGRYILSRAKLVALRDELSYEYLLKLGLKPERLYLGADMAFLMPPASREVVKELFMAEGVENDNRFIIGISPSLFQMELKNIFADSAADKPEVYLMLIAELADFAASTFDAGIYLIPHVHPDDSRVCHEVYARMQHKNRVHVFSGDYPSETVKGLIGECDIFISCRMHASIAALSQAIPTLTLGYQEKYWKLLGSYLGQSDYLVDIKKPNPRDIQDELKQKLSCMAANCPAISTRIKERLGIINHRASVYGQRVAEVISRGKPVC
ncbi:polysaccharide pyruvyl transferase family protein [Dehalococcoides sp.]|jgi:polysaccharide pyruvyl transferase WcaK-like protein|uniref:polysaccharide pyruvyl transferase family protein n=1 Tax=Dehalococcoides sp. TaxID=1966486 RepID=UPI003564870F